MNNTSKGNKYTHKARVVLSLLLLLAVTLSSGTALAYDFSFNTTADFDAGTKVNTTTITDRYNITEDTLELDFPFAEKDPNLVSYWRFEGDANDLLGTNDASSVSNVNWVEGKFGKCAEFDGSSSLISIPDSDSLRLQNFTIVLWLKSYTGEGKGHGTHIWLDKMDGGTVGYALLGHDTYGLAYKLGDGSGQNFAYADYELNANTWYMEAYTYDHSYRRLYINDNEIGSKATTFDVAYNTYALALGRGTSTTKYYYNGTIDELKIYNRPLSADEIAELYNGGKPYKTEGTWTSSTITMTGAYLEYTTIKYSHASSSSYIDKIEWIVNSTVVATYDTDITSGNAITITNDNLTSGSLPSDDFQIKLYLKSTGDETITIEEIYGSFVYAEGEFVKPQDGQAFNLNTTTYIEFNETAGADMIQNVTYEIYYPNGTLLTTLYPTNDTTYGEDYWNATWSIPYSLWGGSYTLSASMYDSSNSLLNTKNITIVINSPEIIDYDTYDDTGSPQDSFLVGDLTEIRAWTNSTADYVVVTITGANDIVAVTNATMTWSGSYWYYDYQSSKSYGFGYYSYQIYAYHNASGEYDHANGTFNVKPTVSLLNVRIPTYFVKKAGDTLQIYALLVSERGEPINFGTCYVNIYYPNGTTLLENQQMTLFYGGVYNYTWTTPQVAGTYSFYVRCNTSDIFGYNLETVEVKREEGFLPIALGLIVLMYAIVAVRLSKKAWWLQYLFLVSSELMALISVRVFYDLTGNALFNTAFTVILWVTVFNIMLIVADVIILLLNSLASFTKPRKRG